MALSAALWRFPSTFSVLPEPVSRSRSSDDPITFTAIISSPQVGQFVGLVRKLDALMISMDTLLLSSVLSNKQRVDGNYAWQLRIIKLARRIIDIEIRARKSAQAKGKEAEVEQAVPATDDDITEEETDTPSN